MDRNRSTINHELKCGYMSQEKKKWKKYLLFTLKEKNNSLFYFILFTNLIFQLK